MKVIEIQINCPSKDVAVEISRSLVEKRLIASSNLFGEIESSYHWKGNIENANEFPLFVKTRSELFDRVVQHVKDIHPYETPSIMGIEVRFVNDDYKEWVFAETAEADVD